MRLAWFSPMPPVATGIARCSADLVDALTPEHAIDVYVDQRNLDASRLSPTGPVLRSAHDFVWRHRQAPYDLVVYQMGNSSHHDYQWPYLFRYPGLLVLHDAHLHHARAACLLRTMRADDYRVEFAWNHPDARPDLAELAVAGFDNHLHYAWPMTRLAAEASRMVAVHSPLVADRLRTDAPDAHVDVVRLGHGTLVTDADAAAMRATARASLGVPPDAMVFGCFGGLSPDKRVPQVLGAFAATRASMPNAHLLLVGAVPQHYDIEADVARLGLTGCSTITGYVDTDEAFTACIAACDATLNLRWPTAREISGPWLRCLAAGKPTVTIDLAHTADVPSIDPRTWQPNGHGADEAAPCTIAIDLVDEDHSLRLAMKRLAADPALRAALGRAARDYWVARHAPHLMADDYRRILAEAAAQPSPVRALPAHATNIGDATLRGVMNRFDLPVPLPL